MTRNARSVELPAQLVPLAGFFLFLLLCVLALGVAALSGLGSVGRGANAATAR